LGKFSQLLAKPNRCQRTPNGQQTHRTDATLTAAFAAAKTGILLVLTLLRSANATLCWDRNTENSKSGNAPIPLSGFGLTRARGARFRVDRPSLEFLKYTDRALLHYIGWLGVVFMSCSLLFPPAKGQTMKYWDRGGGNDNWDGLPNWSLTSNNDTPNPNVKPSANDIAVFNANLSSPLGSPTINLGGAQAVHGLIFRHGNSVALSNGLITVGASGIVTNSGSANNFISAAVALASSQFWVNNSSHTLTVSGSLINQGWGLTIAGGGHATISGPISGFGGILKSGSGVARFSGANSYSGGTTISEGTLIYSPGSVPATGGIAVSPGAKVGLETVGPGNFNFGTLGNQIWLNNSTLEFRSDLAGSGLFSQSVWFGNVDLAGDSTIATNASVNTVGRIDGAITGTGNLFVSGFVRLTNANTFTGQTRILGGDVRLANSNALAGTTLHMHASDSGNVHFEGISSATVGSLVGTRDILLQNDASQPVALTIGTNGSDNTYAGRFTGSGSLIKAGNGTHFLRGESTHTGGTIIHAGALNVASDANLGNSLAPLIFAGGNLQLGANIASARPVSLSLPGGVIDTNGFNATFSGVFDSYGTLHKSGSGTLALAGSNQHTGDTRLLAGQLLLENPNALAFSTLSLDAGDTGTLSFGNLPSATFGGLRELTATRTITLQNNFGGPVALSVGNNNATTEYLGALSGTGSLIKIGTGALTLSGDNSHSGGTAINGGSIFFDSDSNFGLGDISFNGGSLYATASVLGANVSLFKNITLNSGGGNFDSNTHNLKLHGQIFGPGGLVKSGTGTVVLHNSNPFLGDTRIVSGTLLLDNADAISNSTLDMANVDTGTLSFSTPTIRLGGLKGTRDIVLQELPAEGGLPVALSVGFANAGTTSYSGNLTGAGSLNKVGLGVLTLSGNNTYSGGTQIAAGMINASSDTAIGNPSAHVQFNGGGLQLAPYVTIANTLSLNSSGTIDTYGFGSTLSGTIIGSAKLIKTGGGDLWLTGSNSYNGGTEIRGGRLFVSSSTLGTGGFTFDGGMLFTSLSAAAGNPFSTNQPFTLNAGGGTIDTYGNTATLSGTISGIGALTKTGFGTLILSGNNSYSGDTRISLHELVLEHSHALSGSTLSFESSDTGTLDFGILTSATLGGLRDLSGSRNIELRNNQGTAVALSVGNNNATTQYEGRFSGPGSITKIGGGALTLGGVNSHAGGTNINGGAIFFDQEANFGTGNIAFGGGSLFATASVLGSSIGLSKSIMLHAAGGIINSNTHTLTLSGQVSGSGPLAKNGSGALILVNNSNNYTGSTTVNAGVLVAGTQNALGSSSVLTVSQGATLDVSAISNFFLQSGRTLTGHGTVVANQLTLSAGSELSGKLTINGSVTNHGRVAPGFSPEIIHINGDYVQSPNGTLEIEVAGYTPGTGHDQLIVSGTASLSGRLEISLLSGFVPLVGTGITILTAENINFNFSEIDPLNFPAHIAIRPIKFQNFYRLNFTDPNATGCDLGPGILCAAGDPGNFDGVGGLDEDDIPFFALALRDPVNYSLEFGADYRLIGDFDNNFRLDFDDIPGFVTALGGSGGMSEAEIWRALDAQLSVPEPSVISWVLVGGCVHLAARRRGFE
jgi:fibronectin-binding autotransporter adhesin